jgi:HK97 family phage major capsid protein
MNREEIVAALKAIVDGAVDRDLTEDEATRYEELEVKLAQADKSAQIRSRQDAYEAPSNILVNIKKDDDDPQARAFEHFLRTGQANSELIEARALETGSPSEGGYLVPDTFVNKIVEKRKAFGGLANHVTEISTSHGNQMEWVTLDDTSNAGEIVAEEGAPAAGADIAFGNNTLGAYKYMSAGASNLPFRVSWELLQDSSFDIESLLVNAMAKRIARKQATHWVNGTGTGEPLGITYGLTGIEILADGDGITYKDLVRFVHSIDPEYRANAKWAFNDATLSTLRQVVDTNKRPILTDADAGAEQAMGGARLLGYPVVIDQAFSDFSAANNTQNWGVFGDLEQAYVIRRVKGFTMVVDPYSRKLNGQVEFIGWERADGTVQDSNAYVALTGEA